MVLAEREINHPDGLIAFLRVDCTPGYGGGALSTSLTIGEETDTGPGWTGVQSANGVYNLCRQTETWAMRRLKPLGYKRPERLYAETIWRQACEACSAQPVDDLRADQLALGSSSSFDEW